MALIVSAMENPRNRFQPVNEECAVAYVYKGAKLTPGLCESSVPSLC